MLVLVGGYWAEGAYLPDVIWHYQLVLVLTYLRAPTPELWPPCWQPRGPCSLPVQSLRIAQCGSCWRWTHEPLGRTVLQIPAKVLVSLGCSHFALNLSIRPVLSDMSDVTLLFYKMFLVPWDLPSSEGCWGSDLPWLQGRTWWRSLYIVSILPDNAPTEGWPHSKLILGWDATFERKC